MNVKRLVLALAAVAMFAAVLADSASASMTTGGEWYIGATAPGTTLKEGTKETVNCSVGEHEGSSVFTLTGTVGEGDTLIKLTATQIDCFEGEIFNEGGVGKTRAS